MRSIGIYPLGDAALTISFGSEIREETSRLVLSMQASLMRHPIPGIEEWVPAYSTLTVFYHPETIARLARHPTDKTIFEAAERLIRERIRTLGMEAEASEPVVEIPVCYDEPYAVDMDFVCSHCGLDREQVIHLHLSLVYRVYMIGFVPGFPYMGELDPRLTVPRKPEPSFRMEPGSVALAGRQTGIYPWETPGGWQVIGRTPIRIFDAGRSPVCMLKAGMQVRFSRIDSETFQKLSVR